MRISTVLAAKGSSVVTIPPDASIREAVALLGRHGIGALVVSEDGVHIGGIVSERDIVLELERADGALLDRSVREIMSNSVHTCSPSDTVDMLMETMTEQRVRHVPVVEDGVLVGIVSIGDVVKTRIGELEKDRRELEDYIHAR
jgi:CBS domain-containing protein